MSFVRRTAIAASLLLAVACSPAAADHSRTELVSVGPGGNVGSAAFDGASADGTKAFFSTNDKVTPDDTDGLCNRDYGYYPPPPPTPCYDVYERDLKANTTTLISTGPAGGSANWDANFAGMTPDGTHVYFETREQLVPEDDDSGCTDPYPDPAPCLDVYERVGNTVRLISKGSGSGGPHDAEFWRVSDDGTRVLFNTTEQLTAEDTDNDGDTYMRAGDETRLLPGGFGLANEDWTKIAFTSETNLLPEDTDTCLRPSPMPCPDVYVRDLTTGALELVSTGPHDNQDRYNVGLMAATPDLSRLWFETAEPLVDEDVEADCPYHDGWGEAYCVDVYERSGGTTKLISTGPRKTGDDGTFPKYTRDWADFDGYSNDGQRVYFHTREQLVDADTDDVDDAYMRADGVTTLLSGAPGDGRSAFFDATDDGSRVFLYTTDPWSPADTDTEWDHYALSGGSFELLTTGPSGGNGPDYNSGVGNSSDGRRFFFYTQEELTPDDVNPGSDVYERFDGVTTLLSKGPTGAGAGDARAERVRSVADDGRSLFFSATGRLVPEDQDDRTDLYVSVANAAPTCGSASAQHGELQPNKHFRDAFLRGIRDPDGDPMTLDVTGITQDEPVGGEPDARLTGAPDKVQVRAERDPRGDGRVYRIAFRAADDHGGACEGVITVGVPRHKDRPAVDSAPPSFDSLRP